MIAQGYDIHQQLHARIAQPPRSLPHRLLETACHRSTRDATVRSARETLSAGRVRSASGRAPPFLWRSISEMDSVQGSASRCVNCCIANPSGWHGRAGLRRRIAEQAGLAIASNRIIEDRLPPYSSMGTPRRLANSTVDDIGQPRQTVIAFCTGFRDKHWPPVPLVHFAEHACQRSIPGRPE
jgi:hypothetical protein